MAMTLLLAGATGLIGERVLDLALSNDRISELHVVTRRSLPDHPRLVQHVHEDISKAMPDLAVDTVICCLGTTIRKVGGDKDRFIHVDKELVLELGRWAVQHQVQNFCVVSAIGADPRSTIFYNRVKGEMEQGLRELALPCLHIFQPSILDGPRRERRIGEKIGLGAAKLFRHFMPAKYRPMPAQMLADALLVAAGRGTAGVHVHTYSGIMRLGHTPLA